MNKIFKHIAYMVGLTVVLLATGCSDAPEEITEINYDRLFSVDEENMTITVVSRTTLRLVWEEVDDADYYIIELYPNDEDMQFDGSPSKTVETEYEPPVLIEGLLGETVYSGRIKAVSSTIPDSKWVGFTFETDAENIFNSLSDENLELTSVTLSWSPGAGGTDLSTITITPVNGGNPIVHNITAAEMAVGEATISGLTPFTYYTAVMVSADGSMRRGTITFRTNFDGILVKPGDSLADAIASAQDGDVIGFSAGEHEVNAALTIDKSISFVAETTESPIIKGVRFELSAAVDFSLTDLILIGNGNGQLIQLTASTGTYGTISIENCEVSVYKSGIIYQSTSSVTLLENFIVDNCIMHDIDASGGDFIDFRAGPIRNLSVTNSTFYNCIREFVRIDNTSNFSSGSNTIVENCTFYALQGTSNSSRIFYMRYSGNSITFRRSIIVGTEMILTRNAETNPIITANNYYYEAPYFLARKAENATNEAYQIDGSGTEMDPEFSDPENGDFTIMSDLKYLGVGDPRWIVID